MNKLLILLLLTTNIFAKCVIEQKTVKQGNMIEQQIIEMCDDNQKFNVGKMDLVGNLNYLNRILIF